MGHHIPGRPAGSDLLAGFAGGVGGEGALPVPFLVPLGQSLVHLGLGGPEIFPPGHQQKTQTAAELLLGLGVELGAELFHRLAPHLEVLVEVDPPGLQAQVKAALLGEVVARHQLFGQRALDLAAQLVD